MKTRLPSMLSRKRASSLTQLVHTLAWRMNKQHFSMKEHVLSHPERTVSSVAEVSRFAFREVHTSEFVPTPAFVIRTGRVVKPPRRLQVQ
ncbi:hypothetical protein NPIL_486811 [Nephila pilipes]|uniref:Uncharacterized protein n=1 Tax=Nephila pilipes TaxID=299642 RepID=A0A8X6PCL3_NEPPI|nr:hypothetical protein NPIL_486811 [Nephila pilipes]